MLPRLVLLALQLLAAWGLADWFVGAIVRNVPVLARPNDVFAYAVIYALIITIVGLSGSLVLKDVRSPSGGTLVLSLVLALGLAAVTLVPAARDAIHGVIPALRSNLYLYPFIGALVGYYLRR